MKIVIKAGVRAAGAGHVTPARRRVLHAWFAAALAVLTGATGAQALEGLSYTFTPNAERVLWKEGIGLENEWLYGGRLAFNFGRYASLQGFYLMNDDVRTSLGSTGFLDTLGNVFADQQVGLRSFGGEARFNLSNGPVVPYLTGGGGVLRINPDAGETFDQIHLRVGGGFRFELLDRLQASVYAQDLMLRMNRARLLPVGEFGLALPEDPDDGDLQHNFLVGAGVSLFLGGYDGSDETDLDRAFRSRFAGRPLGASVPVEPFIGRLDFDKEVGLDDQEFIGLRTGIDFGPLFGVRGYYWRGLNDDLDEAVGVQSWGGEFQYNLNPGTGLAPFLVLGAGSLDFRESFRDDEGSPRDDKVMLIGGGGVNFNLGQRLRLNAGVRDYMFTQADLEDLSNPDQLLHNLVYSAGFNFSLGGDVASDDDISERARRRYGSEDRAEGNRGDGEGRARVDSTWARDRWSAEERDRMLSDRDRMLSERDRSRREDFERGMRDRRDRRDARFSDGWVRDPDGGWRLLSGDSAPGEMEGGRWATLPIPEEGELYIRFGKPGGVNIRSRPGETPAPSGMSMDMQGSEHKAQLRETIREVLRSELAARGDTSASRTVEAGGTERTLPDDDQLELLERRLAERIGDRLEERLQGEMAGRQPEGTPPPVVVVPSPASPPSNRDAGSSAPGGGAASSGGVSVLGGSSAGGTPQFFQLFTGLSLDDPFQIVFGGRLGLGPIARNSPFRFVPEFSVGVIDETSIMAVANLRYESPQLRIADVYQPFFSAGFGILRFDGDVKGRDQTEGVLNVSYGVSRDFGSYIGFIEHEGVDLFNVNRLLVGLTLTQ